LPCQFGKPCRRRWDVSTTTLKGFWIGAISFIRVAEVVAGRTRQIAAAQVLVAPGTRRSLTSIRGGAGLIGTPRPRAPGSLP
jgi:hypothetical protein